MFFFIFNSLVCDSSKNVTIDSAEENLCLLQLSIKYSHFCASKFWIKFRILRNTIVPTVAMLPSQINKYFLLLR